MINSSATDGSTKSPSEVFPIFGTIVFQKKEILSRPVEESIQIELRNSTFPRFMPLNFRNPAGFNGFKIFGLGKKYVAISYVSDSEENDEWNRPLQRSDISIFDQSSFNELGRDVAGVLSFLSECRVNHVEPEDAFEKFNKEFGLIDTNPSILKSSDAYVAFLDGLDKLFSNSPGFLARMLGFFFSTENRILVNGRDLKSSMDILRFMYLGLPFARAKSISVTNLCTNANAPSAEDVIFTNELSSNRPPNEQSSGRANEQDTLRKRQLRIDIANRTLDNSYRPSSSLDRLIFDTIFPKSDPWYSFTSLEEYKAKMRMIDQVTSGGRPDPFEMSQRLSALRKTLDDLSRWVSDVENASPSFGATVNKQYNDSNPQNKQPGKRRFGFLLGGES